MTLTLADIKLYAINATSLGVCCLDEITAYLKIALLVATLGYTLHKWYKNYKKKDE